MFLASAISVDQFSLDQSLLEVTSSSEKGIWTVGHAVEGVQIFGGIGSGKSSGSGRTLALKYLRAGFGGLVLTVKPDEKQIWQEYCSLAGRIQDLIIIEPGGSERFNFLEYEASHTDGRQAMTENVVEVLKTVINASGEKNGGTSDDGFWQTALDMLIFNVIDLCQLAYGTVSVQRMYDIVQTIPKTSVALTAQFQTKQKSAFQKAFEAAKAGVRDKVDAWEASLTEPEKVALQGNEAFQNSLVENVPEARLLQFVDQFFVESFINLNDKTRSIIDFTFSGFLFRLLREPIYSLFCHGTSTVTPEESLQGKIILLALPVKLYQKVGRDCQILFKYIWQRAMEKRDVTQNGRPLFLWADEAQNFLHEHDADYQATARSSRIATVYISQNLPNYYACMGGEQSQYRVKSFLGTLNTKFFHANADIETNQYASELIGQEYQDKFGDSMQIGPAYGQTVTRNLELVRQVRPEKFSRLKTGGQQNGGKVEGYMVWQGAHLLPECNHLKVVFQQSNSALEQ